MVMAIIMTPFWSAFTEAWVKKDMAWIKSTITKLRKFWMVLTAVTLVMLLLSAFAYRMWVGKDIAIAVSISMAMASYVIINAWNNIHSQFLNGVGKIKMQLYLAAVGSMINIPLAIFLGKTFGIYGVVLSTTIISIVSAVITPIQYKKIINNTARGIWAK